MSHDDQFYLTLFSNSSMDIFPDNVMSQFTCKLPKPLKLDGDYRVGMVEIQYPPYRGLVSDNNWKDEDEDQIIFPPVSDFLKDKDLNLKGFVAMIVDNMKQKNLYITDRYFHDFYDHDKLDEFDKYYKTFKNTTEVTNERIYTVQPMLTLLRDGETKKSFQIAPGKKYKLKELVYEFLNHHYEIYKQSKVEELSKEYNIPGAYKVMGTLLSNNLVSFMKTFKEIMFEFEKPVDVGFYLAVHCDIIHSRMIGNSISKILYFGAKKTNDDLDEIYIQNIQYVPVTKNYIEEISFVITNEEGRRILFESGYKPISITLKFEKV